MDKQGNGQTPECFEVGMLALFLCVTFSRCLWKVFTNALLGSILVVVALNV